MSPKATKINQCPAGLKSAVLGRIRENFTFLTLDGVSFFFERGAYFLGLFLASHRYFSYSLHQTTYFISGNRSQKLYVVVKQSANLNWRFFQGKF